MRKITLLSLSIFVALSVLPGVFAGQEILVPIPTGGFLLGRSGATSIFHHVEIDPKNIIDFRGKLLYEGLESTCDIGKPQIPFVTTRIKIPEGYAGVRVRISDASYTRKPLPVLEAYTPKTWGARQPGLPKPYELKGVYPETLGGYKFESGMNGSFATIKAFPVICDFEKKTLLVATSFELQIEIEKSHRLSSFDPNDEAMKNTLILTSPDLKAQAEKLAKSQRDSGYTVEVVDVQTLKGKYEPQKEEPEYRGPQDFSKADKEYLKKYDYDFAKTIRTFLASKKGKVGFVTVLGDGTHIPPSFYYLNHSYMKVDRYVPSDIYYSSPDLDLVPDFALGRIPVRNAGEAEVMVAKVNDYKKNLSQNWFHSIQLAGGDPFSGGFEGELECQSIIDDGLVDNFKIEKRYKTSGNFNTSSMIDAFRKESGFVYVVSHGSGDAIITEPGKVTTDDIMALPKRSKLPILVSVACLNGMYDADLLDYKLENYPNSKGLSLAQACMASPGGPIAYFGGTRLNYAGINWTVESGVVKAQPFSEIDRCTKEVMNAYHNWSGTLGELMVNAFTKYTGIEKGWFSSNKTTFCFAFFGDPTIKLPATPKGSPHRMPEVDFKNCPMTRGRISIPILSCIDSNTVNLKTDLVASNLRVMDLDDNAKVVDKATVSPSGDKSYSAQFKLATKKLWHARIDLDNGSEVWFYCLGGVSNDVSITNKTMFYTKRPGERLRFNLDLVNDGTKKANDVEITFFLDGVKIESRKIKSLDVYDFRPVNFMLDGMAAGVHKVRFELKTSDKEQYPIDNVLEKELIITSEDTSKTGVMVSYLFNRFKADSIFGIEKFNANAKNLGLARTEIVKIGSDSYWDMVFGPTYENFKVYGCDTIIMASQGFGNPYSNSLVKALSDFSEGGGTIIGMDCLGPSTNTPVFSSVADMFGFSSQADFESEEASSTEFTVTDKEHPLFAGFSGEKIKLNLSSKCIPPQNVWSKSVKSATILAKTSDESQIIASNARTVFLSVLPKFDTPESQRLLYNISTYNLRPQPDASLTLSGLSSSPGKITVGEGGTLNVTVKNLGNVKLENVSVRIDQLSETKTIPAIDKASGQTVTFPIPAQAQTGILEFTATATVPKDVNLDDNSTTLRVRVFETKRETTEIGISDLNVRDGDLLPSKEFQLTGKTQPGSLVSVNGRSARADSKGRFALLSNPGTTPLQIRVVGQDGSLASHEVWCGFAPQKTIGGTIGSASLMSDGEYFGNAGFAAALILQGVVYINITKTAPHLGFQVELEGGEFTLGYSKFKVKGKVGSDRATVNVGKFTRDIQLGKPVMDKDGSVLMPFSAMLDLGFGGDIHVESQSYIVSFPRDRKTESFTPLQTEPVKVSESGSFPMESDFGKPALVSYGTIKPEVLRVVDYQFFKDMIYVWTTRGIEIWSRDGKHQASLGLPESMSKDFDVSWNLLLHPYADEYEHGSSGFLIMPDGSIIFRYINTIGFYDKDWKLIKCEKFTDGGISPLVPIQLNHDGEVVVVDGDGICHRFNTRGDRLQKLIFTDSEGSNLVSMSSLQVMENGDYLIYDRPYFWFASPDWALRLFDKTGKLLKEKIVKFNESEAEKFVMAPTFILGDNDGTYWFINDDFFGVNVEHYDENFKRIHKIKIGEGGLIALGGMGDFRLDGSGMFWAKGKMKLQDDKDYTLLANCRSDFQLKSVIKKCSEGAGRFMTPYDLGFDRDGNLIVYTDNFMERYSQLGKKIDNLSFGLPDDEQLDYVWQLKHEGGYTTGIVETRDNYTFMISGKDNEVLRMIPAVTDGPIIIGDYATDIEKGEIYLTDTVSSVPVKVIPTYLDAQKNPTGVEIIRQFGTRGFGKGKLIGSDSMQRIGDRLYILDSLQSKVLVFSVAGNFLFEFGGLGSTPGKFDKPTSMQVDGNGFIWILDRRNSRIVVYDSEGTFITNLGKEAVNSKFETIDDYTSKPFEMLEPMYLAVKGSQVAVFEYTNERLLVLSKSSTTINMTIHPEKPVLEGFESESKISAWFTVTNTGIGSLDAKFTCTNANVMIEGDEVNNNAGLVKVTLDISNGRIPDTITLDIASTIGKGTLLIPVTVKPVNFGFAQKGMIAIGSKGLTRLTRQPAKIDAGYIFSTKDFPELIPLTGNVAKDDSTVYYTHSDRRLGFEVGKTYATLQIGLDSFKVDLGMKVEKSRNGGLTVPLDVVAAFLSCQLVIDGDFVHVTARK